MKKVLIITYYWPPAGGPGVQRVLKFAKYLPSFGWQPIILTVKNGEYPAIDETLEKDIPEVCKVYKTKSFEPNLFYKKFVGMNSSDKIPVAVLAEENQNWKKRLANWIRLNLVIPDAKIGWIPFAVKKGKKIIQREKPNIIFSSSPPPTVHLIAQKLARWSRIKWVADFRDPWTDVDYYQESKRNLFAKKLDLEKEREILKKANRVITIGNHLRDSLHKKVKTNYCVIPNGFDHTDFNELSKSKRDSFFEILYLGNTGNQRDPYILLKSLQTLGYEKKINIKNVKIVFVGKINQYVKNYLTKFSDLNIAFLDYIPYKQTFQLIMNSTILLLLINNIPQNRGIVTGKLFNYLASGNFILGMGPEDGEAANILEETQTGIMVDYDNEEKLTNILKAKYDEWQKHGSVTVNQKHIQKYSRYNLTKELVNVFEDVSN